MRREPQILFYGSFRSDDWNDYWIPYLYYEEDGYNRSVLENEKETLELTFTFYI